MKKKIIFFLVFLIWELAGRSDISIAFPPISKVFLAFIEMILSGDLNFREFDRVLSME